MDYLDPRLATHLEYHLHRPTLLFFWGIYHIDPLELDIHTMPQKPRHLSSLHVSRNMYPFLLLTYTRQSGVSQTQKRYKSPPTQV